MSIDFDSQALASTNVIIDIHLLYFILLRNSQNCEHQKYLWNVIVLREKSQQGMRKLNQKQQQ